MIARVPSSTALRLTFVVINYAVLSGFALTIFIRYSGVNGTPRAGFVELISGAAYKPFVYRTLLPSLTRLTTGCLPAPFRARCDSVLWRAPWLRPILSRFHAPPSYATAAVIALLQMYFSLVGFAATFHRLSQTVFRLTPRQPAFFTALALLGLPAFCEFGYLYDYSTLFLFTLAVTLLLQSKWTAYVPIFALASLNKETSILLVILFVLRVHSTTTLTRARWIRLLGLQLATYVLIRAFPVLRFRNNPGAACEYHLPEHLEAFRTEPFLALLFACGLALTLTLALAYWSQKPVALRHSLLLAAPLFAAYLLFGYPLEIRVFYEVYPILVPLSIHTLSVIAGRPLRSA